MVPVTDVVETNPRGAREVTLFVTGTHASLAQEPVAILISLAFTGTGGARTGIPAYLV